MNRNLLINLEHVAPEVSLPVDYIMRSTIENVDNKEVLFVSFYSQLKNADKSKAKYKLFICGNEYITLKLENDTYKWSSACIANLISYYYWSKNLVASCYTLEEKLTITEFLDKPYIKVGDDFCAIEEFQREIMERKLNEKYKKIKERIDEAMSKVPDLPKNFNNWIIRGPFGFSRYNYYKRKGSNIKIYCTSCKKDFEIKETQHTKEHIKHNELGKCHECKKKVTFKAIGKSKRISDRTNFAIVQKYNKDGLVVRYFSGELSYKEHFWNPKLDYNENIRMIYQFNKKGQLRIKKYEYGNFRQTDEYRWCEDKGTFSIPKSYIYTRNLKQVVKGTKWQFSGLYDLAKKVEYMYIDTFLEQYIDYPGLEYLIKFKLYNLVNSELNKYYGSWQDIDFKGKSIKEIFGVDKQTFKQMQRLDLNQKGLKLLKDVSEKLNKPNPLTDQQVKFILSNGIESRFINMLDYSTPHKIIKYINSQLVNSKYSVDNIIGDWIDYIRQCKELEFDLNNTFVLYPKNLIEKHEECTLMLDTKKLNKYNDQVIKAFEKLNELYAYSDKKYIIRPVANIKELVAEGHRLRHCVAGTWYAEGIAKGSLAIMLIRETENPEESFYTLELRLSNLRVNQCRGYRNCDATDEINKFIEKWKKNRLSEEMLKVV